MKKYHSSKLKVVKAQKRLAQPEPINDTSSLSCVQALQLRTFIHQNTDKKGILQINQKINFVNRKNELKFFTL